MIQHCVSQGKFGELFIEYLGWDRAAGTESVVLPEGRAIVRRIAHKRGFHVFEHRTTRHAVHTRRYVKALHARICRIAHENILIVVDEDAQAQVWLWAYRDQDTGRLLHRMHPWITSRPAEKLIDRIKTLSFSLDEEESITLPDVSKRINKSLNGKADQQIFFRRPKYGKRSHELALKMREGGKLERDEFIVFHMPLAEWFAKRYKKSGADLEDVAQIAMIALIRAADGFDPEKGNAFSTYAYSAMQKECSRNVPSLITHAKIPANTFWSFRRARRAIDAVRSIFGPEEALRRSLKCSASENVAKTMATGLDPILNTISLETLPRHKREGALGAVECTNAIADLANYRSPTQELIAQDLVCEALAAVDALEAVNAFILRGRFGLGVKAKTLKDLGDQLGCTKERVRQRELAAVKTAREHLFGRIGLEPTEWFGRLDRVNDDANAGSYNER